MFWSKKKTPTLSEQAVTALDRIHAEITDLREERGIALSSFRDTANWLAEINADLTEKHKLCSSLITQMELDRLAIEHQISDNQKVQAKILDIIGE